MIIEKGLVYDHILFEPPTSFGIHSPVVMLCSKINTQRLEPQATWRRRRVIVFGLARSISRYFGKSKHFPREKTFVQGNTSER